MGIAPMHTALARKIQIQSGERTSALGEAYRGWRQNMTENFLMRFQANACFGQARRRGEARGSHVQSGLQGLSLPAPSPGSHSGSRAAGWLHIVLMWQSTAQTRIMILIISILNVAFAANIEVADCCAEATDAAQDGYNSSYNHHGIKGHGGNRPSKLHPCCPWKSSHPCCVTADIQVVVSQMETYTKTDSRMIF